MVPCETINAHGDIASIQGYVALDELEAKHHATILNFIRTFTNPFDRSHLHAHLTGSALIVAKDGTRLLLGYHRKLARWLQMGGHGEPGETNPLAVAMREAREESGIQNLTLDTGAPAPIDLDVHTIPARGDVLEHRHLDIRYLLRAPGDAALEHQVEEQEEVRWFTWQEAEALDLDPSLRRLITKAHTCVSS